MKTQAKRLEVVFKLAERCNINCTYCYMFNKGNEDYKDMPLYISDDTVAATGRFLLQGARDMGAEVVRFGFHGGEPLMIKKARFAKICETLLGILSPELKVEFGVQTNGTLIDDEWVGLFEKYAVDVGVSIDGPEDYNDRYRLDHRGRGTYADTVRGYRLLQQAHANGRTHGAGILSVINPDFDGRRIYRHFVDDLKATSFDFLLPIETHESFDFSRSDDYGRFLCDVFDEWAKDDNPDVRVRIIRNAMYYFTGGADYVKARDQGMLHDWVLMTIDTNGNIGPDDSLKPLCGDLFSTASVTNTRLVDYLNSPTIADLTAAEHALPTDCRDCCWQNHCKGGGFYGRFSNRYSTARGFNNPTALCGALKLFYAHVAAYLLRTGLPYDTLVDSLDFSRREVPPACPDTIRGTQLGKRTVMLKVRHAAAAA